MAEKQHCLSCSVAMKSTACNRICPVQEYRCRARCLSPQPPRHCTARGAAAAPRPPSSARGLHSDSYRLQNRAKTRQGHTPLVLKTRKPLIFLSSSEKEGKAPHTCQGQGQGCGENSTHPGRETSANEGGERGAAAAPGPAPPPQRGCHTGPPGPDSDNDSDNASPSPAVTVPAPRRGRRHLPTAPPRPLPRPARQGGNRAGAWP